MNELESPYVPYEIKDYKDCAKENEILDNLPRCQIYDRRQAIDS